MSVVVSTMHGNARCDAANKSCTKEATLHVAVGEMTTLCLCVSCSRELFTALGFIICSQTGETVERLVGLKRRKGDR